MRYRDAAHVDVHALLARRPLLGWWYSLLGWALTLSVVVWGASRPWLLATLAAAALALWALAWWQIVGRLWRAPLILSVVVAGTIFALQGGW